MNQSQFQIDSNALPDASRMESEEALEKMFLELNPRLQVYCRSRVSHRIADEICQECWLKLWSIMRSGEEPPSVKPLLFSIARNKIIDFWRRKKLEPRLVDDFATTPANNLRWPGERMEHRDRQEKLRRCLERLEAGHEVRAAVARQKISLNSVVHICESLGLSRQRVDKLWFEAKKFLRNCVKDAAS